MKKFIALGAIMALLVPVSVSAEFSDVNEETYYKTAIEWMAENGVIEGYEDGSFKPDQCVNRVELLKMLFITNDVVPYDGDDFTFSDTPTDEWYHKYLLTAKERGLVQGYPDGTFRPTQCVNRAEAAKIVISQFTPGQLMDVATSSDNMPQDVKEGEWYYVALNNVIFYNFVGLDHLGVEYGDTDFDFGPGESMSRKEVAEMLYRFRSHYYGTGNGLIYEEGLSEPAPILPYERQEDYVVPADAQDTAENVIHAFYDAFNKDRNKALQFVDPEELHIYGFNGIWDEMQGWRDVTVNQIVEYDDPTKLEVSLHVEEGILPPYYNSGCGYVNLRQIDGKWFITHAPRVLGACG